MAHGGARPGAGRKRGSLTRKTTEIAQREAASGITPLEFLTKVMKDRKRPIAMRIECAKAAAPYMHPRLSNVEIDLRDLTDDDLFDAVR